MVVEHGKTQVTKLVSGVYPEFKELRSHYAQSGGRFIDQPDLDNKRRVVYVGDKAAKEIFGDEEPVGKTILLNNVPFTVIGIMLKKLQDSNYHNPDNDYLVIPATTFVMIFGDRYYDDFVYSVKDGVDTKSVEKSLFRLFGAKYRFDPKDTHTLQFWDVKKQEETTQKMFFGVEIFMWFIGGMTLLIAGVGVAYIMYVAVRERTKEIGTKIALGAERKHIIYQFMIEALTIAITGGASGMLASVVICRLFRLLPLEGELEMFSQPTINWGISITTATTLLIVGVVAGYFPARKAASVNPVEALRYE